MTENLEFNLEVDLRPSGKREKFKTIDSLQQWLNKEKDFWKWPDDLQQLDRDAFQSVRCQIDRLNDIQAHIDRVKQHIGNDGAFNNSKSQLKSKLESYYKPSQVIHSSHPRAKFIKDQISSDPCHAAFILRYYTQKDTTYSTHQKYFEGALHALLFDYNVKGAHKGELESLEDLRGLWQSKLNESAEEFDRTIEKHKELLVLYEKNRAEQSEQFTSLVENATAEQKQHLETTKTDLKNLVDLYKSELGLQAPIQYWQEKASYHKNFVIGFTGLVTITFFVVGYWLTGDIKMFLGEDTINTVQLWKLGVLAILATIGVWVLRVLIRLLLSNFHLMNDAHERKTMLLTYLALKQEDMLPKEGSLNLILQALFRPTSTGIVKDDAAPPFMAEWIKRTTGID